MKDNEHIIKYEGNHYIVNDDEPVFGDNVVDIKGKTYKVVWCYEKDKKYARRYFPITFSGATFNYGLVSNDLVPVQPLSEPSLDLHFIDFHYNEEN